ncbi:MAG: tetratricopeptide repeat protein [Chloroherpetonaceae bacterium]|nr:tetratricopeptide repeat protein [Chloroherpetonaceae bacterium]
MKRFSLLLLTFLLLSESLNAQTRNISIDSLLNLGIARFQSGSYNRAILDFTDVLQRDPKNYTALMKRGEVRRVIGDSLGSLYDYSTVIKFYPDSAEPFFQRALCYNALGNFVEAQIDFNQAVQLSPNTPNYVYERGLTRIALKNFEGAIADFTQFLKHSPRNSKAYYNRGYCYFQLRNPEAAVKDLSESIVIEPSPEAYYQRALIKEFYRKYNDAILDYDNALNLDANYDEARYARGILLSNLGNNQGMKDLAEISLKGNQKAKNALKAYQNSQQDSMKVYQVPEIVVEAMTPEYQENLAIIKRIAQLSNAAIASFASNSRIDVRTSPFLRTGGLEGLSGQWTMHDGVCNQSLINSQAFTEMSIYCIVYVLRQKVNKRHDTEAMKKMRDVEDILTQIDHERISFIMTPLDGTISRLRLLAIEIQKAIGSLQARMNKIQEQKANLK